MISTTRGCAAGMGMVFVQGARYADGSNTSKLDRLMATSGLLTRFMS